MKKEDDDKEGAYLFKKCFILQSIYSIRSPQNQESGGSDKDRSPCIFFSESFCGIKIAVNSPLRWKLPAKLYHV